MINPMKKNAAASTGDITSALIKLVDGGRIIWIFHKSHAANNSPLGFPLSPVIRRYSCNSSPFHNLAACIITRVRIDARVIILKTPPVKLRCAERSCIEHGFLRVIDDRIFTIDRRWPLIEPMSNQTERTFARVVSSRGYRARGRVHPPYKIFPLILVPCKPLRNRPRSFPPFLSLDSLINFKFSAWSAFPVFPTLRGNIKVSRLTASRLSITQRVRKKFEINKPMRTRDDLSLSRREPRLREVRL